MKIFFLCVISTFCCYTFTMRTTNDWIQYRQHRRQSQEQKEIDRWTSIALDRARRANEAIPESAFKDASPSLTTACTMHNEAIIMIAKQLQQSDPIRLAKSE